jgi:hypothetical protein
MHTLLPRIPISTSSCTLHIWTSLCSRNLSFLKELVAYLEILIAFSVYYRADDACMSGRMEEQFYTQALARYKD